MKALTPETVHGYIRVLKAFCTWLVQLVGSTPAFRSVGDGPCTST